MRVRCPAHTTAHDDPAHTTAHNDPAPLPLLSPPRRSEYLFHCECVKCVRQEDDPDKSDTEDEDDEDEDDEEADGADYEDEDDEGGEGGTVDGARGEGAVGTVALLGDTLVDNTGATHSTADKLAGVDIVGIYCSAHWCPPCRKLTPKLGEIYNGLKEVCRLTWRGWPGTLVLHMDGAVAEVRERWLTCVVAGACVRAASCGPLRPRVWLGGQNV